MPRLAVAMLVGLLDCDGVSGVWGAGRWMSLLCLRRRKNVGSLDLLGRAPLTERGALREHLSGRLLPVQGPVAS